MKTKITTLLIACFLMNCQVNKKPIEAPISSINKAPTDLGSYKKAKNIIFLIGDGMGLSQITAGMYNNNNKISLERFPVVGLHKCHSLDDLVTDSAAGATAFATGNKTYNGAISVDKDALPMTTILEEAEMKNIATGMVVTCGITHATPASFIAHNKHRDNKEEIALDFLKTDIDLFIGGGKSYFENRISDNRNLLKELMQKSYIIDDYNTNIENIDINTKYPYAYFTADKHPLMASEGRNYLKTASTKAIEYLNNRSENGFFMMIEGSQIDWGGHANDAKYILDEMKDFNTTINAVLDWAEKDGETLVIVTADHETGGFAINPGSTMTNIEPAFTTGHHTAVMIPVFAFGPGSSAFSGIYENTAIHSKMKSAFGWNTNIK